MDKSRRITKLMEKGFSCIDECRYRDALRVGRELKKLRHSSAFEILALAYLRSGKLPRAIKVLEEGVAKAGRVWLLWELLGNCYSDAGRYSKAERTYQKALQQESCDSEAVHLNRAIAFNRARRHREALAALRLVNSASLHRRAEACRIRTALALGHTQMARRVAKQLSRRGPKPDERYDPQTESEICYSCALALKDLKGGNGSARRLAIRAVCAHADNAAALELIRELLPRGRARPLLFRVMIHGVWDTPFDASNVAPQFFRTIEVAAENPQAALRHAKPFFPKEVRKSLTVEETRTLPGSPRLEGVYFLSGYFFYRQRKSSA